MRLRDLDLEYLKSAKHFHLSSLFLQRALEPDLPALFRELKGAGLTISLDTNDDPSGRWSGVLPELLEYVDLLLPNEAEACHIAKKETVNEALDELAPRVPCVAVKCGSRGSVVRAGGRDVFRECGPGEARWIPSALAIASMQGFSSAGSRGGLPINVLTQEMLRERFQRLG